MTTTGSGITPPTRTSAPPPSGSATSSAAWSVPAPRGGVAGAIPLPRERSCPYKGPDEYARLREEQPIARLKLADGTEGWLLTRYEDVRAMLADSRFSARDRAVSTVRKISPDLANRFNRRPSLLNMDPPEHTRQRRLLTGQFSVRRMRQLAPRIHQIVTEHLDAMITAGPPADLVPAFALPIPSLVICELLGVPYADRTLFQGLSRTLLQITSDKDDAIRAIDEIDDYMLGLVNHKRREPADDLLSALVHPSDPADELTDGELVGLGTTLLIAGHETTANMIGLGTYLLLQQPATWTELAAAADSGPAGAATVESAVEELLRYLSIVHFGLNRRATEDLTLGGVHIRAGEIVVASLIAADSDPDPFPEPDLVDLHRGRTAHVAFGHGIHQCLGQQLARIELNVVFSELPRRLPSLALAVPADQVPMRDDMVIYGVHQLPVTWDTTR
jgi:cytochrome P450